MATSQSHKAWSNTFFLTVIATLALASCAFVWILKQRSDWMMSLMPLAIIAFTLVQTRCTRISLLREWDISRTFKRQMMLIGCSLWIVGAVWFTYTVHVASVTQFVDLWSILGSISAIISGIMSQLMTREKYSETHSTLPGS